MMERMRILGMAAMLVLLGAVVFPASAAESAGAADSAKDNAAKKRELKNDEMKVLFRENPEAFRKLMRERAEKQRNKESAFWKELDALGLKYRQCSDPAEKEAVRQEIVSRVSADYRKHLNRSRQRLEELKKRVEFLEAEQKKREESAAGAVAFRVGHILAGTQPPPPPRPELKNDADGERTLNGPRTEPRL